MAVRGWHRHGAGRRAGGRLFRRSQVLAPHRVEERVLKFKKVGPAVQVGALFFILLSKHVTTTLTSNRTVARSDVQLFSMRGTERLPGSPLYASQ